MQNTEEIMQVFSEKLIYEWMQKRVHYLQKYKLPKTRKMRRMYENKNAIKLH